MISHERLEKISQCSDVGTLFAYEQRQIARELLALRKAFSEPRGYERINKDGKTVNCLKHNPTLGDWSDEYWADKGFSAVPLYRQPTDIT